MNPLSRPLALAVSIAIAAITFAASSPAAAVSFEKADINGDGFVTIDEYKRTHPFERRRDFHQADRRKDGRLDREEYDNVARLIERKSYRGD